MNVISEVADRICVMERGRIMTIGATSEVFADEPVRASYLGEHLVAAGAVAHSGAAPVLVRETAGGTRDSRTKTAFR